MANRGRWLWLALLVVVALAIVAGRFSGPPSPVAAPPDEDERAAATHPDPVDTPERRATGPSEAAPVADPRERDDLPDAIHRYLDANVYPPGAGRLSRQQIDLLEPNRRFERALPLPGDPGASYLLTADHYYYSSDETVRVTLEVTRGGEPVEISLHSALALAEGRRGASGARAKLDFREEPDGSRVAELRLDRNFGDHHGPVVLQAEFGWAPGSTHSQAIRIFVTPTNRIPARFTGVFRDRVHEGDLRVEVGVDVAVPGFYRFDANAFDATGAPLAFTAYKGPLAGGAQWVPLDFFGKTLRDANAAGSITIANVRGYRFIDGGHPDRERMRSATASYTTRPYPEATFSDAPHTSEHQLHMVELMLEDVAAGISLDTPPIPTSAEATPGEVTPGAAPALPGATPGP